MEISQAIPNHVNNQIKIDLINRYICFVMRDVHRKCMHYD